MNIELNRYISNCISGLDKEIIPASWQGLWGQKQPAQAMRFLSIYFCLCEYKHSYSFPLFPLLILPFT
jgi:hypothetical protein